MKLRKLFALASLVVTGIAGASSANAQGWGGPRYERHRYDYRVDRHDRWERQRHWDRGRHRGWDRGRSYGWNGGYRYNGRRVCWTEWRYGRPVQICRRR